MKIGTRLTLIFSLITAALLFVFAGIIYYSAYKNRETEFYSLLRKEALTKANLLLEAKVDALTLQGIYSNNRKLLNEVEVAVYDRQFELLYHDAVEIDRVKESREMLEDAYQKKEIQFYVDDWQVVMLRYEFDKKVYIISATAYDQYGYNKLQSLLRNSVLLFFLSIFGIFFSGYLFSRRVLAPIKEITEKMQSLSAGNLHQRLAASGNEDELSVLTATFNAMLDRLENSFDAQKHFVYNISHELRTPLAAIIAELELSLNKKRAKEEYRQAIVNTLQDAKRLVKLSNSLLDLAKADYDPKEIQFRPIRLDELLLDARLDILKNNSEYRISIGFREWTDEETLPEIYANEYLLKVAFANLMENACKFSEDKHCEVEVLLTKNNSVAVCFRDRGQGISAEDLARIFEPFYRGGNKTLAGGNGIGLYLVQKIIMLHKAQLELSSKEGQGTNFELIFELNKL